MAGAYPRIEHHGGAAGVTGSCHRLRLDPQRSLLVDCGLFQGHDAGDEPFEQHQVRFALDDVLALVVTHVHIDHIGRLPYLLAAGYTGPILCSPPTARLLPLVIEDALAVGFTRDRALIERFLATVAERLVAIDYGVWHGLVDDAGLRLDVRLQRAGHILGSAYVEVDAADHGAGWAERIVFSGDLGAPHAPLLPAPAAPERADRLVLESTYGDRVHESRAGRTERLRAAIEAALADGGTVIIPAFSIGRTQELLYEIEALRHAAPTWRALDVVVDSPLAAAFTGVYRELRAYWDAEASARLASGRHPLSFDGLVTVADHAMHQRTVEHLAVSGRPAVVLAASGMCAGGRVVNYLRRMLPEPRHGVVFVGYQAAGTPGRAIQAARPGGRVEIDGERVAVRARIATIGGYSAHGDRDDLVAFVTGMPAWPGAIRLVHGEPRAQRHLRGALEAAAAQRRVPGRVELGCDVREGLHLG